MDILYVSMQQSMLHPGLLWTGYLYTCTFIHVALQLRSTVTKYRCLKNLRIRTSWLKWISKIKLINLQEWCLRAEITKMSLLLDPIMKKASKLIGSSIASTVICCWKVTLWFFENAFKISFSFLLNERFCSFLHLCFLSFNKSDFFKWKYRYDHRTTLPTTAFLSILPYT